MLQFPNTKKDPEPQPDLASKCNLLRKFAAQIAPVKQDQSDLLCAALAPTLIQLALVNLWHTHLFNKTEATPIQNAQLEFLFHGFVPGATDPKTPAPNSFAEVLNLIQTGDASKKAEDNSPILPAPLWTLTELEDRLVDQLARTVINLCGNYSVALAVPATDESPAKDIDEQIKHLSERVVSALTAFMQPKESQEEKAPLPSQGSEADSAGTQGAE